MTFGVACWSWFRTDTCPYCDASLPAMQKLAEEMKDAPVTFVGLYQSKPLGSERTWTGVVAHAAELGVTFPIAYDHDWGNAPNRRWLGTGTRRRATSASFVIDAEGRFVHVHPGPVCFPERGPRRRPRQRRFRSHSRRDPASSPHCGFIETT